MGGVSNIYINWSSKDLMYKIFTFIAPSVAIKRTVTIFQVSGILRLLWPLATTNYGGLQAANSHPQTS